MTDYATVQSHKCRRGGWRRVGGGQLASVEERASPKSLHKSVVSFSAFLTNVAARSSRVCVIALLIVLKCLKGENEWSVMICNVFKDTWHGCGAVIQHAFPSCLASEGRLACAQSRTPQCHLRTVSFRCSDLCSPTVLITVYVWEASNLSRLPLSSPLGYTHNTQKHE